MLFEDVARVFFIFLKLVSTFFTLFPRHFGFKGVFLQFVGVFFFFRLVFFFLALFILFAPFFAFLFIFFICAFLNNDSSLISEKSSSKHLLLVQPFF